MTVVAGNRLTCLVSDRTTIRIERLGCLHLREDAAAEIAAMTGRAASTSGCVLRDALVATDPG